MNQDFASRRPPRAGRGRTRLRRSGASSRWRWRRCCWPAGCAQRDPNRSGLFEPFRTDLPQGNYLTREMLDQVKPGMTRDQVRFALGTPLLRHIFHPDRWDYVFRYQFPNGRAELRRATIMFSGDRVTAIDATPLPDKEDPNDPALPGYRPPSSADKAKP